MTKKDSKISPNIRSMVKWIAVGDVLFGIAVMLLGHYIIEEPVVQWFGAIVALVGGLLFFVMRVLEKRDHRKIN